MQAYSVEKVPNQITKNDLLIFGNSILFKVATAAYSMKNSSWHPLNPITKCMAEIKAHGPHFVKGQFGREYYASSPFQLTEKMTNRPILAWKAGGEKILRPENHATVVVGARTLKDRGYVYFIDPHDRSNPHDFSTQKVYMISYKTFGSQIASLDGLRLVRKEGDPAFLPIEKNKNNYALHM